jgi:hypothetical protein
MDTVIAIFALLSAVILPVDVQQAGFLSPISQQQERVLAQHQLDLTQRHPTASINQVFVDNILLSLRYLKGSASLPPDWENIRQPFVVSFTLQPGETFAFHPKVPPKTSKPAVTMNSRFFIQEGYRTAGGIGGNGVCHLASFINWAASQAGLEVKARVNHNFAPVPGIPRQFGTTIFYPHPAKNLYLKNTLNFPIIFTFQATPQKITLAIFQNSASGLE